MTQQLTTPNLEVTREKVEKAVAEILNVLGEPRLGIHKQAREAFSLGNHQLVKRLATTNLSDYYCKSLGYLGGALKLTPNTDTILAEAARAAADFQKEKTLQQLGDAIASALE